MEGGIRKTFLFNLAVVVLLCMLLYIGFFTSLHWFTKHGEELTIPDMTGRDMNLAINQFKAMHFEVLVDSTYEPEKKPLTVLKQVPDSGSIVKEGRTVFLTVNMLNPPHIPMPNLINLSYRSAEMLLRNNKLKVGDTSYKPDIASGAVLEQNYKGTPIHPGEMIAQGSKISLVLGDGLGNRKFIVPVVTGMSVEEAMIVLNQYNLQVYIMPYDQLSQITDTPSARIVETEPAATNESGGENMINDGDLITLKIMQNPTAEDIHSNRTSPASVNDNKPEKKK